MKTLLLATAFAAFALPALAADAIEAPPEAPVATEVMTPVFTWSGPYLGVQGGGSFTSGDYTLGGVRTNENFDGGIIGAFAGYNYQFDNSNIVAGIEGDIGYIWNKNDAQGIAQAGTDVNGAVRARIGYAMDRALIYGAAGWTAASGYTYIPGVTTKDSEMLNGYTVGAGVDYAITDKMFGRVEYRFNDYGSKDVGPANLDFKEHRVTVGLGVKF